MSSSSQPSDRVGSSIGDVAGEEGAGLANSSVRLGVAMAWVIGAVGALAPMLPIYFSRLGVTASDIALLMAVQAAGALLVAQVIGYIADAFMKRTTLLLLMCVGGAAVSATFPLLPPRVEWLAVGMLGLAVFVSQRIALFNAIVFDSRRGEERFGRIRLVGSAVFTVTTLIVGFLADLNQFTVAVMWPLLVLFDLFLAFSLFPLVDYRPSERPRTTLDKITFRRAQGILLRNPLLVKFLFFTFVVQAVAQPMHVLQIKYLIDLGGTAFLGTGAVAVAALSEMVVFFYAASLIRRIRLMPLFGLVPVVLIFRMALVFAVPNIWVVFGANIFHLVTFGLAYMCSMIFINREVPSELKSSGQTLFGLTFGFFSTLTGNLGAYWLLKWLRTFEGIDDLDALRLLFGIGAAVATVSLLSWWPMKRAYERKHQVSGFWIRGNPPGV